MNSFRFVERGIEAEIDAPDSDLGSRRRRSRRRRSTSTRSGSLTALRSKEEVHDYRYFPEPDLVPLAPTEEMLEAARTALPELPAARLERYQSEYGLPADVAGTLVQWEELGRFFEDALAGGNGSTRRAGAVDDGRGGRAAARAGRRGPA